MRRAIALVAVLSALAAAACSKTLVAIPVYTITASEPFANQYSFDVPSNMKGGVVTLRVTNAGQEPHDFQLVQQASGHTLGDLTKEISDPNAPFALWVAPYGGVGTVAPGKSGEATLDIAPGTYWFVCTESSDTGVSHATHGMSGAVTFTGRSGAIAPAAPGSIVAKEYTFDTSGLVAGSNTVRFTNSGRQFHHFLAVPITAGKTLDDVKAAVLSENASGPPPVDLEESQTAAVIAPGQTLTVSLTLAHGTHYAFLCFIPDRGTAGPPHVAKGMLVEKDVA
ncbi:MAG: cupredoxin domain-containing protein [Actinobacteria bacterium]|nr:cupredoxin domain-containing protein [Actinomycetota bacterium]